MNALQALRAIASPHSAEAFLKALHDSNSDNAYSAMQGLLALAGGGAIDWVPTWKQFDETPQFYAERCREWWQTEKPAKIRGSFDGVTVLTSSFHLWDNRRKIPITLIPRRGT
jgi:hypothetical protein